MIAGEVSCQGVARGAVLPTHATAHSAVVHVSVLHVFAQVGPHVGQPSAVPALVHVLPHLHDLGRDDPIDFLEECRV